MGKIRVAVPIAKTCDEKAMCVPSIDALDTHVSFPLKVMDFIDLAWQITECLFDFLDVPRHGSIFECRWHHMAQNFG